MKTLPSTYAPLLADFKARVRAAQVKAAETGEKGNLVRAVRCGSVPP